jgi:hypothetical protein
VLENQTAVQNRNRNRARIDDKFADSMGVYRLTEPGGVLPYPGPALPA